MRNCEMRAREGRDDGEIGSGGGRVKVCNVSLGVCRIGFVGLPVGA